MKLLLIFLLFAFPVYAINDNESHLQSAFLFAKDKNWSEAIAHARLAHSPILVKYFTFEYLKDPESEADFASINDFLAKNPDWPDRNALEKRAEVALMASEASEDELNEWFSKHPPQTYMVKLKRAKTNEELNLMIRTAWINDNYDKKTESKILQKYHAILRASDQEKRIDRLLWEGKNDEAKRLLKYASPDYQHLFQARIYLNEDKTLAPIQVLRVPARLKGNAGLYYERLKWRLRNDDKDGVRELLLLTPNEIPYPEKWWTIRDRQIREALDEGNLVLAEKLLHNHGQKIGTPSYREAKWLTGWIALQYHNSPDKAFALFKELLEESETPAGKAKAAYWAGRAAEKIPKTNAARWYGESAAFDTTFYGQLGDWELKKNDLQHRSHTIHSATNASEAEKANFKKRELVQLVYALANANQAELAGRFIYYLATNAKSDGEAVLAVGLGREIHHIEFGVRAAKKALQDEVVALENGWPIVRITSTNGLEKALILGLVRQESEFYTEAVSSSNAIGLMQLLPSTAKEIARKEGMRFSTDKLYDPDYNMNLGSNYLNRMITKFDGSYVLAVASYNAGPGRVQKWVNQYGKPGTNAHEVVDWIEKIPYSETRNYVQHVLENTQIYRYLLAGKTPSEVMIGDDLVR